MARPLRLQIPGGLYHLTARGNNRGWIYLGDDDRELFLELLAHTVGRFGWLCHAYCLMGNHYHLLVETPLPNLSRAMRQLNGLYAQTFNHRHGRIGHVFQARFHAILVQRETHLLRLCRYIVRNPLRARIVGDLDSWAWSSYHATAGLAPTPAFLTTDWVLGRFGRSYGVAHQRYRAYVAAGAHDDPKAEVRGQIYLGDDQFINELSEGLAPIREVPRLQWQPLPPTLPELLDGAGADAISLAYRDYGYTMREIGDHLGVHYATIGRWLRRTENAAA